MGFFFEQYFGKCWSFFCFVCSILSFFCFVLFVCLQYPFGMRQFWYFPWLWYTFGMRPSYPFGMRQFWYFLCLWCTFGMRHSSSVSSLLDVLPCTSSGERVLGFS
ncbi:hypothetical protein AMTRI_Chr01g107880 [Amborella trichopoda]